MCLGLLQLNYIQLSCILGCLELLLLKEYFQLSLLYEVFNVQRLLKLSEPCVPVLSAIRNLNSLKPLITGKTSFISKPAVPFRVVSGYCFLNPAATYFPMPSPA